VDEGAGDGDATPHAAGEAARIQVERLVELDKFESLVDAGVDLIVGHALLDELVGNVVADGEGVEERAFLKDHAGAGAQGKQQLFTHGCDLLAEEQDASLVRAQQSIDELEQDTLAHAGGAKQNARLTGSNGEADVLKNGRAFETDGDVVKRDDRRRIRGLRGAGILRSGMGGRVSRKSKKMIITEEKTTASMVERPTPSVPPVVLMP